MCERYIIAFFFMPKFKHKDAKDKVEKRIDCPMSKCNRKYKVNEHSEDNENW